MPAPLSLTAAAPSRAIIPMPHTVDNVACTVCGCVCDDLRVTVKGGRVTRAEGACFLAEPWFLAQETRRPPAARIDGEPAPLEAALDRAAEILRQSRSPLVYAVAQEHRGAAGRRRPGRPHRRRHRHHRVARATPPPSWRVQDAGESVCTLGEVKNRADLVIFWGSDPVESHPRHFERYSVDARGLFTPRGRADRTVVVADVRRSATAEAADLFLPVEPGRDFEALSTLRGLIRGLAPVPDAATGAPVELLTGLAERMKKCRFGVIFFGLGLAATGRDR